MEKIFEILLFQLQVTIPSAYPVQFSSQSDYCVTLSCHSVVSHKKSKKKRLESQKRGLATTVQPDPDFSRACSFHELLGINEVCLEAKFQRNR